MSSIERINVQRLQVNERAEVDAGLRGPAMHRDNNDIVALWLFLLAAGAGGIGVYFFAGLPFPYVQEAALVAGVVLIVWTIQHWVRTAGDRGTLRTSFGTFIVRGTALQGMRHANVAAIKCRTIGKSGNRFTVFELVANDRTELRMYVNPPWAEATIATIQQMHGGRIPVSER
ncbi:MAG: hypothetical protein JWL95_2469 [Gemmatimonadetes bacterium]|nr:hypothetical protein [Gemmatimonadota bacterium]